MVKILEELSSIQIVHIFQSVCSAGCAGGRGLSALCGRQHCDHKSDGVRRLLLHDTLLRLL